MVRGRKTVAGGVSVGLRQPCQHHHPSWPLQSALITAVHHHHHHHRRRRHPHHSHQVSSTSMTTPPSILASSTGPHLREPFDQIIILFKEPELMILLAV